MPGSDSRRTAPAETGAKEDGTEAEHPGDGEKDQDRGVVRPGLTITAIVVACVVVSYYLGFMTYMAVARNDPGWDHLLFLLSGLEAIVFAAGGLLFGTTIQRGVVQRSQAEAGNARVEAHKARKRADQYEQRAAGGQAVAAYVRGMPQPAAAQRPTGAAVRDDDARRRAERAAAEYEVWHTALVGMVDAYFPAAGKE